MQVPQVGAWRQLGRIQAPVTKKRDRHKVGQAPVADTTGGFV